MSYLTSPAIGGPDAPGEGRAGPVAQVLAVDQAGGPAQLLAGVLQRVLPGRVALRAVSDHAQARAVIGQGDFDLVLVGLEEPRPELFRLLADTRIERPDLDVLVVARGLSRPWLLRARYCGARKVVRLPARASQLKALIRYLAREYLQPL